MPTEAPPIFILSCERSGSTLLHYILDTHPDICCPGELYMGQLAKLLRLGVSRTTGFITPGTLAERDGVVQREVRGLLQSMMDKHLKAIGKKVWCDKTPFNLNDLGDLQWAFPEARFLCLYRRSLDVVQSVLELPEKTYLWWSLPYVVKYPQNYVAALLENWVEKNTRLLELEKEHPRTYRLRYEDLVKDPAGVLAPLFGFLGLKWDPELLDRVFRTPHDPGGGDPKIQRTERIEKDRVGRGHLVDARLLDQVPGSLRERQRSLEIQMGYWEP